MTKIQEMVEWLENTLVEAKQDVKEAKQYGVNSPGFNAYLGRLEKNEEILDEARLLAAEEAKEKPKNLPQRQDSLQDQLSTVRDLARKNGCYDAEDWIVNMSGKTFSEKPTAPASLVEELRSMTHKGCDCWHCVRINEAISRYRPTPTEDIVGELKQIIKYVGKKSADPWDNGYATCAHEVEEIIRKYEEGK